MIGDLKLELVQAMTEDIDNSIEIEQPEKLEINLSKK